jgi:hypothetical protein
LIGKANFRRRPHPPDGGGNETAGAPGRATGGQENNRTVFYQSGLADAIVSKRMASIFDDRWQAERAIFAAGRAYPGAVHA